ncbi:MAG: CYTH domain-containing protein, partial [Erysipelotrichia bacterium]|nr:CYTH domain-containing protein [Erysipelotrichia bacterium]
MSNAVEMEIKLILDKRNQAKLLKQSLIKNAMREKEGKLLKLVSTYYDTRDYKLANTGMAYRVRKTGKAYEATVKTMGENIGGFSARGEYTVPLAKRKVVLKGFGTSFDKKLQTLLADDELQKLFDVEVNRTIYM